MRIKLSFLNPKNWYYWIQSKYRKFINSEFSRIWEGETPSVFAESVLKKAKKCNDCFLNGECLECGCNFYEMTIYSDKDCPLNKWSNVVKSKSVLPQEEKD